MASTLSLFAALKGVIGTSVVDFPPDGLFAPSTFTTSADILLVGQKKVTTSTVTELISIGSGSDIASAIAFIFVPSGACRISWRGSGSDADNSAIVCQANAPLILPGYQTLPYQSTSSNRLDETAASITSFSCYHTVGSDVTVKFLALG